MRFSPGLQGLRGVAIMLVIACHLRLVPGGWVGVDVFFALSGFLITRLLVSRQSLGQFYLRRARRLLPALVLLLAAVAVIVGPSAAPALRGGATYSMNFLRFHDNYEPLGHLWSLAQEEQFYLVWPLLLLAVRGSWRLPVAAGLALAAAIQLDALVGSGAALSRVYYGPDAHALPMALGCVLALGPWRMSRGASRVVGLFGAAAVTFVALRADLASTGVSRYETYEMLAAVGSVCLVVGALSEPRLLRTVSLQRLGLYSYGLYLWHYPLIAWLPDGLAVILTVVVAVASYHLVELPIREVRGRRLARTSHQLA